jgi:hypothetical protein
VKKMEVKLNALLGKLNQIYDDSEIKQTCIKENQKWGYSLVTTPMEQSEPLILGFNWGAAKGQIYPNQTAIKKTNFLDEDVGSLKRIIPFIRQHLGEDYLTKASQSNYCFFRSSTEDQINETDIKRCSGVFAELIEILAPSSIICLSAKLRKHLIDTNQVCDQQEKIIKFRRGSSEIEFVAVRGKLASGVDIKFLPHPNYPMKRDARSVAWQFCCGPK